MFLQINELIIEYMCYCVNQCLKILKFVAKLVAKLVSDAKF